MLCNGGQEVPNCIPVVTGNPLNTPNTVLFNKMFANRNNLSLGKMSPEEDSAFCCHEELLAVLAIVTLLGGSCIFPSFDNVFSFFQAIIVTGRVLTNNINTSTRSDH